MSAPVLRVQGVTKRYQTYKSELSRIAGWFGGNGGAHSALTVLADIAFDVHAGEALAIIGRNGAGKSTLLKIVTGTTRATTGSIEVAGTVSAILELGMGFNPDFTGRQNAAHALSFQGHQRTDIEGRMADIEAFTELGDYFDQPIRIYSTGMQMRLAFGVATAFRPDLLIIDEALAVGDIYFQNKSFDRIRSFREAGTAIVLVSHDKMAVLNMCNRAILLHEGAVVSDGDPSTVLDYYNAILADRDQASITTQRQVGGQIATISGTGRVAMETITLETAAGAPVSAIAFGETLVVRAVAKAKDQIDTVVFGLAIKDRFGQVIFGTNTHHAGEDVQALDAGEGVTFAVKLPMTLRPGEYSITLALTADETHLSENYEWRDHAASFSVVGSSDAVFDGLVYLPVETTITR